MAGPMAGPNTDLQQPLELLPVRRRERPRGEQLSRRGRRHRKLLRRQLPDQPPRPATARLGPLRRRRPQPQVADAAAAGQRTGDRDVPLAVAVVFEEAEGAVSRQQPGGPELVEQSQLQLGDGDLWCGLTSMALSARSSCCKHRLPFQCMATSTWALSSSRCG